MTMTTSLASTDQEWPTLVGRRQAEHESIFDGDDTRGNGALKLAGRMGSPPMPWQQDNVRAILRTTPGGTWTHPVYCLICVRQAGKSEILLLRCLYGLFKLGETIIYSTQQWKTAKKLAQRLAKMIKARPSLQRRLLKPPTFSGGQAEIHTADGGAILFTTRSNDVARGWDEVDLLIVDEAYNVTEGEIAALTFTQMAAKNPQAIYASSAVNAMQHANGEVLAGIRRKGLAHAPRLGFREYMAPEPPPGTTDVERARLRESPEVWRTANPSHGVVQTDDKVEAAMIGFATAAGRRSFEVEILGWGDWPVDATDRPVLINAKGWKDMGTDAPTLIGPRVTVLDREPAGKRLWVVTAAQRTTDNRIYLEIGYHQQASNTAVVKHVVDIATALDPIAFVIDAKSDAAVIEPDVIDAKIEPTITNTTHYGLACGGFLDDALDGRLTHGNQSLMNTAISLAGKKDLLRGGFIWDAALAGDAIATLRSAALARWALLTFGEMRMPTHLPDYDTATQAVESAARYDIDDGFDVLTARF
jgi:hypothetical protein